jgi:potassium voltage-gated channel Eag-related subfamily H protein 8
MQNFDISAKKKFKILTKLMNNQKYSSISPLINNGDIVDDAEEKSELLNKFFAAKAKVDDDDDEVPILNKAENVTEVGNINTSPIEVAKIIRGLKKSNLSHCGVPGKFISLIATPLSFALSKLFNNLFEEGIFPSIWKISHITAVFKNKGKKSDVANYRPISLLPTLSKVCESIIHKRLLDHCLGNTKQAAYIKGDSTVQQLIYIVDKIKKTMDKRQHYTWYLP